MDRGYGRMNTYFAHMRKCQRSFASTKFSISVCRVCTVLYSTVHPFASRCQPTPMNENKTHPATFKVPKRTTFTHPLETLHGRSSSSCILHACRKTIYLSNPSLIEKPTTTISNTYCSDRRYIPKQPNLTPSQSSIHPTVWIHARTAV